ncbi:MAG: hypothetical protein LBL33_09185 [Tannerella sp.]|jgi:hypothetical protein|nr:hypothetical protein [Tannerella sp.]
MSNDYLPSKDKEFHVWTGNFLNHLSTLTTKIGFPDTEYTKLLTEYNDFSQKLNVVEDPTTRTSVAVEAKTISCIRLKETLRADVKAHITYNPLVSDDNRTALGLPIHKTTRTHSPIAAHHPDYDIDSSELRRLKVHFYDQGQKKTKAKPAGQHGVRIKWAILSAPPASLKELVESSFDTRTPFTIEFDESDRGKTVYFCLCWVNTRGENGPWSEIISAIIP